MTTVTQIFLCHYSEKNPTLAQVSNFKFLHVLLEGNESRFIRLACTAYVTNCEWHYYNGHAMVIYIYKL